MQPVRDIAGRVFKSVSKCVEIMKKEYDFSKGSRGKFLSPNAKVVVKCVEVSVQAENVDQFIEVTKTIAAKTRAEQGNLRFEIHQSRDDPTLFFLFETYKDENAISEHKATDYYTAWRKAAEPLMAKPRRTSNCKIIDEK